MKKYTITTGTALNFDADSSWAPINIRSAAFAWTASGSGTGEYYLRTAAGADPSGVLTGLVEPANVQANGTALTAGTAGSLTASTWDWADNDTLGYSTIYVRLSDDTDPDTKTDGFVTFTDSPNANDDIYFRGAASFNGGDFSTIELDDIVTLPGFTGAIGDATRPLKLDTANASRVEFNGTGVVYIGLGDAAVSPVVNRTGTAANGSAGLYIDSTSALNDLFVKAGTVKLIGSSVDDAYVTSGGTLLADTASACTGDIHNSGTVTWDGAGVDLFNDGGTATINGTDAWATVEATAGTVAYNSTGTLTSANALGTSTIDTTQTGVGRTITTVRVEGTGKIFYDGTTTVANVPTGDGVKQIKAGAS